MFSLLESASDAVVVAAVVMVVVVRRFFPAGVGDDGGDEEADDPSPYIDEVDEDREAADEDELKGLDNKPPPLHITQSDICKGVLALEKVRRTFIQCSPSSSHTRARYVDPQAIQQGLEQSDDPRQAEGARARCKPQVFRPRARGENAMEHRLPGPQARAQDASCSRPALPRAGIQ